MDIFAIVSEGAVEALRAALAAGADPNQRNSFGETPLHYAAHRPRPASVLALLAAGADPNLRNRFGATPLHYAAYRGPPDSVLALLAAGAAVDARDNSCRTPLDMAKHNERLAAADLLAMVS